jgi:hypothetical protein
MSVPDRDFPKIPAILLSGFFQTFQVAEILFPERRSAAFSQVSNTIE